MNTHNLKTQHETAIEKLNDVDTQRRLKALAEESINGFEGLHMPDQKRKAEQSRDKCEVKIHEAMVDYRKHTMHHITNNGWASEGLFAEWLNENRWYTFENGKWRYTFEQGTSISKASYEKNYVKTSKELYELFIKSNLK